MSDLQTAFYIIGIIFMGVSLVLLIGLIAAVFIIRNKIVSLEHMVEQKVHAVTDNVGKVIEIAGAAQAFAQNLKKHK